MKPNWISCKDRLPGPEEQVSYITVVREDGTRYVEEKNIRYTPETGFKVYDWDVTGYDIIVLSPDQVVAWTTDTIEPYLGG